MCRAPSELARPRVTCRRTWSRSVGWKEADRLQREAVASLFATGIDPMSVIRWKDIFDSLENAVGARETAARSRAQGR
jgi:hypothetical protein